jgi:hypothetical protein
MARFQLWADRLLTDAEAKKAAAIHGDVTTLAWIRDRIAFTNADGNRIDDLIRYLRLVAEAKEFNVTANEAVRLRQTLAGTQPSA